MQKNSLKTGSVMTLKDDVYRRARMILPNTAPRTVPISGAFSIRRGKLYVGPWVGAKVGAPAKTKALFITEISEITRPSKVTPCSNNRK